MRPSITSLQVQCPVTSENICLSYVSSISDVDVQRTCVEKWAGKYTSAAMNASLSEEEKHFCLKRVPHEESGRLMQELAWLMHCSTMLYPALPAVFAVINFGNEIAMVLEYLPVHDVFEWTPSSFSHGFDIWFETAMTALQYLCLLNVAHNDISVENLSCRIESGMCVILDFENTSHCNWCYHQSIPTKMRNRAPELSNFNKVNKHLSDLFAFGVACAQICLRSTKWSVHMWTSLHQFEKTKWPEKVSKVMSAVDIVAPAKQGPPIISLLSMSPTHRMKAYEQIENVVSVK